MKACIRSQLNSQKVIMMMRNDSPLRSPQPPTHHIAPIQAVSRPTKTRGAVGRPSPLDLSGRTLPQLCIISTTGPSLIGANQRGIRLRVRAARRESPGGLGSLDSSRLSLQSFFLVKSCIVIAQL